MDQAVHPLEVDERAEVDDVGDRALDDVAGVEPVEDRLAHLLALVLEDGAAREDDVVPRAVELDHLAAELLAEELVEVLHAADVDERRGEEAADAEVEDQAALDDLDHAAVDRLAALGRALDRLPGELEARALLREEQAPLRVLLRHHERVDLVADRDLVGRVHVPADRELGDGDDALGLVADVDQHLVLVDTHDRAVDHLPFVDRREGAVVVGDQLPVGAGRPDAGFGLGGCLECVVAHRSAEYSGAFGLAANALEIRHARSHSIRNATVILELSGRRILVDPMLDPAGARPPIESTANPVPQPDRGAAARRRGGRAGARRACS